MTSGRFEGWGVTGRPPQEHVAIEALKAYSDDVSFLVGCAARHRLSRHAVPAGDHEVLRPDPVGYSDVLCNSRNTPGGSDVASALDVCKLWTLPTTIYIRRIESPLARGSIADMTQSLFELTNRLPRRTWHGAYTYRSSHSAGASNRT